MPEFHDFPRWLSSCGAIADGDLTGFPFREAPLPPPEDTAIESAPGLWTLAARRQPGVERGTKWTAFTGGLRS
ncbi:hypothetical protein A4R43_30710 [Amycolatopsis albispora]|uniref:Uncharacterized protein n=1 Tax=Amycolatopsis albispora TaxID=1804986 RepID=A0A344LE16_9PSEU|nr:hypothetical protein A4R43_30710 [Amycolatopsis albispora]